MVALVIDASLTLAWCFEGKSTPSIEQTMARVISQGATSPGHWQLEVSNGLRMAERRKRLAPSSANAMLDLVRMLPVQIDADGVVGEIPAILQLSRSHNLTTYDAAYLELALRKRLPLATMDTSLRAAATQTRVTILPS